MLHLPLKSTEKVELHKSLHRFIESAYSPAQAEEHREACAEAQALRERVRLLTLGDSSDDTLRLLSRYYRLLSALSTRFGGAVERVASRVSFTWRDGFKSSDKAASADLRYERACTVWNLAAALSHAGAAQQRAEAEGMRCACQLFQQAAGALEALHALAIELPAPPTLDLHPKAILAWRTLMLAQAQQCYYEKARRDQMKAAVVSKLAAGVRAMSGEAAAMLRAKELKGHFDKWAVLLEAHQKLFDALAHFHAAESHEQAHEYGAQVCRLEHATSLLSDLTRQSKHAPPDRLALYNESFSLVSGAAQHASRLNSTVYTERVPPLSSLPPIEPKSIVKPIPVAELRSSRAEGADGSDDDLFRRLVPLTVLQEASIYTAQRDEMLREMADTAQTARQMAEAEMEGMDLPYALQECVEDERLPKSLVDQIAEVQRAGGEELIVDGLRGLAQRAKDMQAVCMSIDVLLEVDEGADLQLQQAHGASWRCLRSTQLTADTKEELAELRSQLQEASAADSALEAAYNSRRALLEPLSFPLDVLEEQVPHAAASLAQLQCTQDCKSLVESIGTLIKAQEAVVAEARTKAEADDITQELVYRGKDAGGSNEQVFEEALQRFEPLRERLQDAVKQQDELLGALRHANEAFTRARFDEPLLERRSAYFRSLHTSVRVFSELQTQLISGVSFYDEVQLRASSHAAAPPEDL